MGSWVTSTIREDRYDKIIEILEEYCEQSDSFSEIEYIMYIIKDLEEEKALYLEKQRELYEKNLKKHG